ncbi:MAG: ABC transporter permease [Nitrososphaerales archaeon]
MRLYQYALRRIVLSVFVLFGLSLLIFFLVRGLLPPAYALAPYITPRMDDSAKLSLARSLGVATASCPSYSAFVDLKSGCIVPLWQQYGGWLIAALQGNFGYTQLPGIAGTATTWSIFFGRFPYTAELAIVAAILTVGIGIPLGVISATHNNKLPDHISRLVSLGGYSVPQFLFGALLLLIFALYVRPGGLGLFPASGAIASTCAACFNNYGQITRYTGLPIIDALVSFNIPYFWDSVVAIILPALTLAITSLGAVTRIVRSSMMDALKQDYILLAKSKGLRERDTVYTHALRNALLPAVTVSGLLVSYLLGGAVIVEIVFSWPGVGNAILGAAEVADVNFIELYLLVTAAIIIGTNLMVDILYALIDPRIRY